MEYKEFFAQKFEITKPIAPKCFCLNEKLDGHLIRKSNASEQQRYFEYIKQGMANKLAYFIVNQCSAFELPNDFRALESGDPTICIEIDDKRSWSVSKHAAFCERRWLSRRA